MKIMLVFCLLIAFRSQAQTDTSNLLNFSISARAISYLSGNLVNPDNDEYFSTFLKWRTAFRTIKPAATTNIVIDTLPVSTAVFLYNWTLSNQEGFNFTLSLKNALTPYRAANANLDRQMTAVETAFSNQVQAYILIGRKWLLGK